MKFSTFGKAAAKFLLQTAVITVLLVGIDIAWRGMYLLGNPQPEQVQSVTVEDHATGKTVTVTSPDKMETACHLFGFLRYRPFAHADTNDEPLYTLTFQQSDGTTRTVSANHITVWWRGKAHRLNEPDIFCNLTEGIFFSQP